MSDGWTLNYLLSFITLPNVLGATGAIFYVISMSMKTAIPLRITSLVSVLVWVHRSWRARSAILAAVAAGAFVRLYQMRS
jgi:hypothetical protein